MGARDPDGPKQSERRGRKPSPRQLGCKVELGKGKGPRLRNAVAALGAEALHVHTGRSGKEGPDFSLELRYEEITVLEADGPRGTLTVTSAEQGTVVLHLGRAAEEWRERIAGRPTRLSALGVTARTRVLVVGVADEALEAELVEKVRGYAPGDPGAGDLDVIVAGVEHPADLPRLARLAPRVRPGGVVWAVFAEGTRGVDEHVIAAAAAGTGLAPGHAVALAPGQLAVRLVRG